MQHYPGERSVLAFFPSSSGARKAAEELRGIGYETVHVDRISHYGARNEATGEAAVGRMTMFSSEDDPSEINNMVTGGGELQSGGRGDVWYGQEGGKAFLVTVLTGDDGNAEQVNGILEKHGGRI